LETEPRGLTFGVRMTVVAVIVAAVYALISMILILSGAMTLVLVVAMLLLASVAVGINYLYWRPWYRTHRYAPLVYPSASVVCGLHGVVCGRNRGDYA
jgi:hypothetical protein